MLYAGNKGWELYYIKKLLLSLYRLFPKQSCLFPLIKTNGGGGGGGIGTHGIGYTKYLTNPY